jgi:phasin family protein
MPDTRESVPSEGRHKTSDYDVTKLMADFRFKPLDFETLMAAGRRNIEALTQANQLAIEGVQAVTRRQIEIARQTLDEASALFRDLVQPASNEERLAKNTEFAKQAIEKSLAHGRELAALATKAGNDAAEVLYKRAREGLDELREFARSATTR